MATEVRVEISGSEKAQSAFQKIADAEKQRNAIFKDMNASYQKLSTNVNGLNAQLRALTEARDRSFNPVAIERFNAKIAETQKKLTELKSKGVGAISLPALSSVKSEVGELSLLTSGLGKAVLGAFAVSKVIEFGSAVFDTTRRMQGLENSIKFVSKTEAEFQNNMNFLRETSERLGLDLESAARGFKTIAGAALPAGISSDNVRKTFESVAKASTAMGLSAEDTEGIFLALGQMISKGTVQAEELRGQLGERLPGAFNLAAQAMGVTTAQLDKMLQNGQVVAKDFLPKFANELDKVYSAGVKLGSDGLNANANRFNSALTNLYKTVGDYLAPAFNSALKSGADFLNFMTAWIGGNKEVKNSVDLAVEGVIKEKIELNELVKSIRSQNITNDARQVLLAELNQKFPEFAKSIDIVKASEKELEQALKDVNKQFDLQVFNVAKAELTKNFVKETAQITQEIIALQKEYIALRDRNVVIQNGKEVEIEQKYTGEILTRIELRIAGLKRSLKDKQAILEDDILKYKELLKKQGLTEEQADAEAIRRAKQTYSQVVAVDKKAIEEQAKQQAEFQQKELEAQQKLAVLTLENKIKNNAQLLEQENITYQEKLSIIAKGEALELELIALKNTQAKTLYEVDKNNQVQVKKQTQSELKTIDEQSKQSEIEVKNKTKTELSKIDKEIADSLNSRLKQAAKATNDKAEEILDIEKEINKEREEETKRFIERQIGLEKEKENRRKAIIQAGEQVAVDLMNFGFDNKANKIQAELDMVQKQKDYELGLAGDNEAKKVAINQQFAEKERQLKIRQAQSEKQRAIFEILMQTGVNVVKAFPNPLQMALAAGIGAIQAGIASARQLPKYKQGTEWLPLHGNPDGVDTVPILANKGERIVPTEINRKLHGVKNTDLPALVAFGLSAKNANGVSKENLVSALKEVFAGLPTDKVVFDKNGFAKYTQANYQIVKNLNADYEI